MEALWVVAMSLGLRQGELLGLRWSDVDFRRDLLECVFRWQLQRVEHRLQLVPLKTAKSRRRLPMPLFVAQALENHRARQEEEGLVNLLGLVFTNQVGQPIDARHIQRRFKVHLRRAGLGIGPSTRFGILRPRSYCSKEWK